MSTVSSKKQCPDVEDISSWVDAQAGPEGEAIGAHLKECPKCGGVAGAYQRIDHQVRSIHSDSAPHGLSEHIKARCRSLPPAEPAPAAFPTLVWKMAAVLALVMAATALYSSHQSRPVRAEDEDGDAGSTGGSPVVEVASTNEGIVGPRIEVPGSLDLRHRMPTTVDVTDLTRVGGQTPAFRIGASRALQPVPRTVRHVWLVPESDWSAVRKYLNEHHPQGEWVTSEEQAAFEMSLADTALQALVDQMDNAGAALVSGTPPQPREAVRTAFTGRDVGYRMVFITQK